jgi:peptidoglycan hydrolase CwlO-like protein
MAEHEWGERLQAHLDELEQVREKMQARQDQLEQRVAALEAQSEIVVDLMTQVADMLDEWQALRQSLVAEDSAHTQKGQ